MPAADQFLDQESADSYLDAPTYKAPEIDEEGLPAGLPESERRRLNLLSEQAAEMAAGKRAQRTEEGIDYFQRGLIPPEVLEGALLVGGGPINELPGVRKALAETGSGLTSPINIGLAAATMGGGAIPGIGNAVSRGVAGGFATDIALNQLPEVAQEAGRASVEGTPEEQQRALTQLGLTGLMAGAAGYGAAKAPKVPEEIYPPAPSPDVVARNLAAPGTVRPQELQRIGPFPEPEAPAMFQAGGIPFKDMRRFGGRPLPPVEILPQMGRLPEPTILEETRPKQELETRGKVSFGAEAPTLTRTAQIPKEVMEAIESAQSAGLSRSAAALKGVQDASSKPKAESPIEREIRAPVGEGTPLRQQGEAAEVRAPNAPVPQEQKARLVPAIQTEGGKLYAAERHPFALSDAMEDVRSGKISGDELGTIQQGFYDLDSKQFLTRAEAAKRAGGKVAELTSEDLPAQEVKANLEAYKAEKPDALTALRQLTGESNTREAMSLGAEVPKEKLPELEKLVEQAKADAAAVIKEVDAIPNPTDADLARMSVAGNKAQLLSEALEAANGGKPAILARNKFVPVADIARLRATENGGRLAIILPDGSAVVGGRMHADLWNKAVEKGLSTDAELSNGISGFIKPDGTAWGVNGKPLPKVERVRIVDESEPRPSLERFRPPEPSNKPLPEPEKPASIGAVETPAQEVQRLAQPILDEYVAGTYPSAEQMLRVDDVIADVAKRRGVSPEELSKETLWKAEVPKPEPEPTRGKAAFEEKTREIFGEKPAEAAKYPPAKTPMMQQWQRIKAEVEKTNPKALLAFRLGDFFEFFYNDAETASKALKIALTKRNEVPMAGVPYHAADRYWKQLTNEGHEIAIVDLSEAPAPGKLAERKVTEIVKPETSATELPEAFKVLEGKASEAEYGNALVEITNAEGTRFIPNIHNNLRIAVGRAVAPQIKDLYQKGIKPGAKVEFGDKTYELKRFDIQEHKPSEPLVAELVSEDGNIRIANPRDIKIAAEKPSAPPLEKAPHEMTLQEYREREAANFEKLAEMPEGKDIVGMPVKKAGEHAAWQQQQREMAALTRAGKNETVDQMHRMLVQRAAEKSKPTPSAAEVPTQKQNIRPFKGVLRRAIEEMRNLDTGKAYGKTLKREWERAEPAYRKVRDLVGTDLEAFAKKYFDDFNGEQLNKDFTQPQLAEIRDFFTKFGGVERAFNMTGDVPSNVIGRILEAQGWKNGERRSLYKGEDGSAKILRLKNDGNVQIEHYSPEGKLIRTEPVPKAEKTYFGTLEMRTFNDAADKLSQESGLKRSYSPEDFDKFKEPKPGEVKPTPKFRMTFEEFRRAPREGELLEELKKLPRAEKTAEQKAAQEKLDAAAEAVDKAGLSWIYDRLTPSKRNMVEASIRRLTKKKKAIVDAYEAALNEQVKTSGASESGQRRLYDRAVEARLIENPQVKTPESVKPKSAKEVADYLNGLGYDVVLHQPSGGRGSGVAYSELFLRGSSDMSKTYGLPSDFKKLTLGEIAKQFEAKVKPTIEQKLEGLKISQDVGGQLRTNPLKDIPVAVWNGAVDAAILAVKAGRTLAEGIEIAIQQIRKQVNKFDEERARAYFKTLIENEVPTTAAQPVPPAQPSRTPGVPPSGPTIPPSAAPSVPAPPVPPRIPPRGPAPAPSGPAPGPVTLDDVYKRFEPSAPVKPTLGERAAHAVEAFRTGFSSMFRPTNKIAEDIAKRYGGKAKDIAGIFEQLKGSSGKAEADVYRFDKEVSDTVKGNEKDFSPYLFLRRSIDRLEQDARDAAAGLPVRRKVSTYSLPELYAKLAQLESNLGPAVVSKFKTAADLFQQHMDTALRLQVDSGRMSPEVYKAIKDGNQFYAPFKVMKYIEETLRPEGTGRKIDTVADYTKAMEGIEDADFKLGDMLAAARQNITLSRMLAEKNYAMREIAALEPLDTHGVFIKKLAKGEDSPKGFEAVNVMENGEQQRYAVDKTVADAIQASPGTAPILLRWAGSLFRASATTFNLPFQVGNFLIADQPRAALVSKYGVKAVSDLVRYPMDLIESTFAAISGVRGRYNQLYLDFLDSGAAGATVQEYLTPESLRAQPTGGPLRALSTISDLAQAVEETSKIVGVKRAMREHGATSGAELARNYPEAITEIRRFSGSPDFGRMGKWVDAYRLNLINMFLNARIQGAVADIGRLTGRDGSATAASTWLKMGAAVGTPTLLLYILNHSDKYAQDYAQRPEQEKRNYWLIPKDSFLPGEHFVKGPQGEQIRDFIRIPKREIAQWMANGLEAALDFARLKDPEAFWKFATSTAESVVPVNIQGKTTQERIESVAAGFNPIIKAPLEVGTGRDLYRHKNIIPDLMKKASPEQQYTDRTPEIFKKLAEAMPDVAPEVFRSPLMLENMTKNVTASVITQFLPRKPVEGRSPAENVALFQRFQSLPFTDSTEFDEKIQQYEREAADVQLERFRSAQKIVDEHKGASLEALVKNAGKDPKLIERVIDVYFANQRGITSNERRVLNLPVDQRAAYIAAELKDKTPEEKAAIIRNYSLKRILTAKVAAQLADALKP